MEPTVKSNLLWGVIGCLSFLVLIQAYHLVTDTFVGIPVMVGVALVVGAASGLVTHVLRPHVARWNERT